MLREVSEEAEPMLKFMGDVAGADGCDTLSMGRMGSSLGGTGHTAARGC